MEDSAARADVAERLRAGILAGDFAPGQRLVEAELTELFQTTRGVIRAALVELGHQGIVERVAHRGARVRPVSLEEAVAITEVRMVIEGLCAAKAAERVSADEIAELRTLGHEMREAVRDGEVLRYSQLNSTLHDRIREISGQPVASEVLTNLQARNVRHAYRLALRPGRPQASLPEHLAIIERVAARDPVGAERAARHHVAAVLVALSEKD